ncbi:MAG TPA: DNA-3-methyladenine glycosylase [Nitrososphaeraceae archaeon]|nr:DNA-3-methyladenine glycosylase [Nitrososphaeraceae archaeon]
MRGMRESSAGRRSFVNCLDASFYARSTELVARDLLGKTLVRLIYNTSGNLDRMSGMIVETEAYGFKNDAASHAYSGLTSRNAAMFGEVGRAYIYFTYGSQYCVNVSARSNEMDAGAVLIRALQPLEGIEIMKSFRKNDNPLSLTSGPGKLSQALSITKLLNGEDMTDPESRLHIEDGFNPLAIVTTKRIGINQALDKQWRFVVADATIQGYLNKYASRKK